MVQLYCSEQIAIPETFPNILKTFAKAAIRTQPYDILQWSSAYFRCLANNAPPPAKCRLERECRQGSLTKGYLKVLIAQVGKGFFISRCLLQERWKALCLPEDELRKYLSLCRMLNWPQVHWLKLLAVMIGCLNKTPQDTMAMVCELLTDDVDGGLARIPYWMFKICYTFVAQLDCSKEQNFVNGQMVLPWGDLEEVMPMDRVPRVLSATLLKDTIITSCKAKFDKPHYTECTCPLESPSDTASTIFMINSQLGDPKELLTKCEDFDTIMLLLKDTQSKSLSEPEFRGPHYISKKQVCKAQKIEEKSHEQRLEQCDKSEQQAQDHLKDEAFQMLREVGPPWTWLHQFTANDINTTSYNFIDQESIISDPTPDITSVDTFDLIKEEPKPDKDQSVSSSCYLSEADIEEHRTSLESLKSVIEEGTQENKCDVKSLLSVVSYLKAEEWCVLQGSSERFVPILNLHEIIKTLEMADSSGIIFSDLGQLVRYVDLHLRGRIEDFLPTNPKTDMSPHKTPEASEKDDICCVPCRNFPDIPIPPEWAETIPKQVEVPPRAPREPKPETSNKSETEQKDDMTAIFDNSMGLKDEQAGKMPKFCFDQKDSDELILGLIPLVDEVEEVEEEDYGSPLPESETWSGKGYRSDDEDIFVVDEETPRKKVPRDDMQHYCCLDAPTLEIKPYVPPPEQFNCSLAPFPGIGPAISQKTIDDFLAYLRVRSRSQNGLVYPRNFKEEKCPYMVDTGVPKSTTQCTSKS